MVSKIIYDFFRKPVLVTRWQFLFELTNIYLCIIYKISHVDKDVILNNMSVHVYVYVIVAIITIITDSLEFMKPLISRVLV